MRHLIFTAAAILALSPIAAQAQQNDDVVRLPDGQTALNISATERVEVDQDVLVASLRIQKELKSASEVQNTINLSMKQAVELVKGYDTLKVETGQYYVHPDYRQVKNSETGERSQEIDGWRGSQTLTIKSETAEDVLKVAGEIQDIGFVMNGLNYELSTEKYDATRDSLMEKTVAALKARAERVAKALGKSSVDIVEINVDAQSFNPGPVYAREQSMKMMSMDQATMATPTAEAGTSDVSMTISARAILKP